MASEAEIRRTFFNTLVEQSVRSGDIAIKASMTKLGENRIAYQALQLHGGYGHMEEYHI